MLSAYTTFLKHAKAQFDFISMSPQILPHEFTTTSACSPALSQQETESPAFLDSLEIHLRTNGANFICSSQPKEMHVSHATYLASVLDPCLIQLLKATLQQAELQLRQA